MKSWAWYALAVVLSAGSVAACLKGVTVEAQTRKDAWDAALADETARAKANNGVPGNLS